MPLGNRGASSAWRAWRMEEQCVLERVRKSVKYEQVKYEKAYLHAYSSVAEARASIMHSGISSMKTWAAVRTDGTSSTDVFSRAPF